jgi:hypothetical protein
MAGPWGESWFGDMLAHLWGSLSGDPRYNPAAREKYGLESPYGPAAQVAQPVQPEAAAQEQDWWAKMVGDAPDALQRSRIRGQARGAGLPTDRVIGDTASGEIPIPQTPEELVAQRAAELRGELSYAPDPQFSDLGLGIAFGDLSGQATNAAMLPSEGQGPMSPQSKLERIREEVRARTGGAPPGGGFTVGPDNEYTREIEEANRQWLAEAPLRDMEWEATSRYGDPDRAAKIAQSLSQTGRTPAAREQIELARRGQEMDYGLGMAEMMQRQAYYDQLAKGKGGTRFTGGQMLEMLESAAADLAMDNPEMEKALRSGIGRVKLFMAAGLEEEAQRLLEELLGGLTQTPSVGGSQMVSEEDLAAYRG